MKLTVKLLTLLMALCLVLTLVACGDDSNNNNSNGDDNSKPTSTTVSVDSTPDTPAVNSSSSTVESTIPQVKVETVSYSGIDGNTGATNVIEIVTEDDIITEITKTTTIDCTYFTADQIQRFDKATDEAYNKLNDNECSKYERRRIGPNYNVIISFKDLDVQENADYLSSLGYFGDYGFGTSVAELGQILSSMGYTAD